MNKEILNLRPVATSNLIDAMGNNSLANEWPLYTIPRNRIAYKLYYYMLSKSAQDHQTGCAFISDRYWTKKEAAEVIGCTPRSITNNLETLKETGLLQRDDIRKAYIFPH